MDAWPAVKGDNGTLNVATPGAENGCAQRAYGVYRCPDEGQTIEVLETFDFPGTGNLTRPQKINDRGVIAGIYLDSSGVSRGFFRSAAGISAGRLLNLTTLLTLPNCEALITNAFTAATTSKRWRFPCFFRSYGTFTEFDVPGGSGTQIFGINNVGDFAGDFLSAAGIFQAYVSIGGLSRRSISRRDVSAGPISLTLQTNWLVIIRIARDQPRFFPG
jgi:hypothetical protein